MRYLVLFIVVFVAKNMCAQQAITDKSPEEALESYYELPRETIYLHLNKSTYVKGENLWFKGYVYNLKENTPFKETTNVYVGLYDKEGKQIDKRLFLAKDGYVQGNFEIDSTFAQGDLYIKAATNWMRNFKEDLAHVQKLRIVNLEGQQEEATVLNVDYDVQFLPEGGHMVSGIANTIGVKVLNNRGYGAAVENGVVLNDAGVQVAKFITNTLGHGKFRLTPEQGVKYKAVVDFPDQKQLVFDLPMSYNKGVAMELRNNSYQDKIPVYMEMNLETLQDLTNTTYYALVHKDDKSIRYDFQFSNNSLKTGFFIHKKDIPKGVNTITVFNNNNQPILERLFFNSHQLKSSELELKAAKIGVDSISISLSQPNMLSDIVNLSASVLPRSTTSYSHSDNIYSSFYLKPYLKGYIENAGYYFENVSPRKEFELDLLLLNQGWSRYSWQSIFSAPLLPRFEFESGLTVNVRLNESNELGKKFYIFPTLYHSDEEIFLKPGKRKFTIDNNFLERNEEIFISEVDDKGDFLKSKIYVTTNSKWSKDKVVPFFNDRDISSEIIEPYNVELISEDRTISLDEVVVTESKIMQSIRENPSVPSFLRKRIEPLDERTSLIFPKFIDFIGTKGYKITTNPEDFSVSITSYRGGNLTVILNGVVQNDLSMLRTLWTEDIESYFFDRVNFFSRTNNRKSAESLYVFYKRGGSYKDNIQPEITTTFRIEQGFESLQQFYTPKYSTYFSKSFEELGVIHWEPEILLKDNKASFKIIDTGLQHISIFIEGMDAAGNLFTLKKNLSLESF